MLKPRPPREQRERRERRDQRSADRRALDEVALGVRDGRRGAAGRAVTPPAPPRSERAVVAVEVAPDQPAIASSTDRRPGAAVEKSGDVLSPAFLAWVREQACGFCGAKPPVDPHHFPGKGQLGMTIDLLAIPACRSCHERAQRYEIARATQQAALFVAWVHFLTKAPKRLKHQVFSQVSASLVEGRRA